VTDIHPFKGWIIDPQRVDEVVAPSYDAMTPAERVEYCRSHPRNYLTVMRSLDEFGDDARPSLDDLLAGNRSRLEQLLESGAFVRRDRPSLYVYRLALDGHEQTGLVAEIPVEEYEQGRVLRHEHTRSDKEDQLARYQEVVGASSSPIALAYPPDPDIDAEIDRLTRDRPLLDFVADDGLHQTIWAIEDTKAQERLRELFAGVGTTYLTDGHHRAASAARYAARRRRHADGDGAWRYMLALLFPGGQLRVLSFNRCVRDLGTLSAGEFLARLDDSFHVTALPDDADDASLKPRAAREFVMLLDGSWYRLTVRPEKVPDDPVAALDVSLLQDLVLEPLLGIRDVRSDPRLDYVSDALGVDGLRRRAESGWRVAFNCHPTSIAELMTVADAGAVMPPKSTCFDPKARSGIFLRLR
jgi:uncharacterized protein (DUF1015 family)